MLCWPALRAPKESRLPSTRRVPKLSERCATALRGSSARKVSLWTLQMAAQVSFEQGLIERRVCGETIRATLARLLGGVHWQRAKRWITSPDPLYERKKGGATD